MQEDNFMPKISERTKESLSKNLGISYERIIAFELDEEIAFVESKTGKKIAT